MGFLISREEQFKLKFWTVCRIRRLEPHSLCPEGSPRLPEGANKEINTNFRVVSDDLVIEDAEGEARWLGKAGTAACGMGNWRISQLRRWACPVSLLSPWTMPGMCSISKPDQGKARRFDHMAG